MKLVILKVFHQIFLQFQTKECIEAGLREGIGRREMAKKLYMKYGLDPNVTILVWNQLEMENPTAFQGL